MNDPDEDQSQGGASLLLVVSHAGRGLFDVSSGQRLARDDEMPAADSDWIDPAHRRVRGIGSAREIWCDMVGLWGGALARQDGTGWESEVVGKGRREQALIGRPSDGGRQRWRVAQPLSDIRAFGFSASGRWLVLATSSEVSVFARV